MRLVVKKIENFTVRILYCCTVWIAQDEKSESITSAFRCCRHVLCYSPEQCVLIELICNIRCLFAILLRHSIVVSFHTYTMVQYRYGCFAFSPCCSAFVIKLHKHSTQSRIFVLHGKLHYWLVHLCSNLDKTLIIWKKILNNNAAEWQWLEISTWLKI